VIAGAEDRGIVLVCDRDGMVQRSCETIWFGGARARRITRQ